MSVDTVDLPIKSYARQIVETVKINAITIVIGETGSGKTTQIPQASALTLNCCQLRVKTFIPHECIRPQRGFWFPELSNDTRTRDLEGAGQRKPDFVPHADFGQGRLHRRWQDSSDATAQSGRTSLHEKFSCLLCHCGHCPFSLNIAAAPREFFNEVA